jgi:hypothetical protein
MSGKDSEQGVRRIEREVRALVVAILLMLALATDAAAGIAVDAVAPKSVRAGATLRIRVSSGLRLWEKIPLYLVPSASALRPRPCKGDGICEPKVAGPPPAGGRYLRIATVSFRKALTHVVLVKVPQLRPGRYEVAFYCGVCYRGPGGSLISTPGQAFEIVR